VVIFILNPSSPLASNAMNKNYNPASDDKPVPHEILLIEDVKSIYSFQHHLTTLRGLVLGATVAIMGAIITYSQTKLDNAGHTIHENGFKIGSIHLTLMVIAVSMVMIMGALNRAQFVFGAYISSVQQKLAGNAFWSCLRQYLEATNHRDTIGHGFAVGVAWISYAMCVYVALGSADYLIAVWGTSPPFLHVGLVLTSVVAALVLMAWTWCHVRNHVDTKRFKEIVKTMEKVVDEQIDLSDSRRNKIVATPPENPNASTPPNLFELRPDGRMPSLERTEPSSSLNNGTVT
jgi:hypothetical protein